MKKQNLIDKDGYINTIPRKINTYNIDGFFAAILINND